MPLSRKRSMMAKMSFTTSGARPRRGLVHHDELGPGHHGAAYRQHLLLAAGKSARQLPAPLFQPGKQRVNVLDVLLNFAGIFAKIRADLQIFQNRQIGEDAPPLRHQRNTALHSLLSCHDG